MVMTFFNGFMGLFCLFLFLFTIEEKRRKALWFSPAYQRLQKSFPPCSRWDCMVQIPWHNRPNKHDIMQHYDTTSYYNNFTQNHLNWLVGCSLNNCPATMIPVSCSGPNTAAPCRRPLILGMLPTCPRPLIFLGMSPRWLAFYPSPPPNIQVPMCKNAFNLMKLSYQQNFLQVEQIETRLLMTHPQKTRWWKYYYME